MIIVIENDQNQVVATLAIDKALNISLHGTLPGGLTVSDLHNLGYFYYEISDRGEPIQLVREVPVSECLAYIRALQDALPPKYHVASVKSPIIERERAEKLRNFEKELEALN